MTETPPPSYPVAQPLSQSDERMWAVLIHIGGIIIGFLSPLIGYLVLKDRSRFVGDSARIALNFQITLIIAWVAATILTIITFGLLAILYLAVAVVNLIFCIVAAVAANRGEVYRYPLTIQFIK